MRIFFLSFLFLSTVSASAQEYYEKARNSFNQNRLDSARFYINRQLAEKPQTDDYFLSALIHEAHNAPLRALADYEAVIQRDPGNVEAHFQKGLIYYHSGSFSKALEDFTFTINNIDGSQTRAIYFGIDPYGAKGTFVTTLQSMKSKVYQYRGMTYQSTHDWEAALRDFNTSLAYDSVAEVFINRSQLFSKKGEDELAIQDLTYALALEPDNYLAWYNLALLDETARLPKELAEDQAFSPILNLMAANAYESRDYALCKAYYTKSLQNDPRDDLALVGRGKAHLRLQAYQLGRADFIKALQINPQRTEAFYLIGNSFFYEQAFDQAVGFYEQYLSMDPSYSSVWYNAAMSYLSTDNNRKGCDCLKRAAELGMEQANQMLDEHCDSQ